MLNWEFIHGYFKDEDDNIVNTKTLSVKEYLNIMGYDFEDITNINNPFSHHGLTLNTTGQGWLYYSDDGWSIISKVEGYKNFEEKELELGMAIFNLTTITCQELLDVDYIKLNYECENVTHLFTIKEINEKLKVLYNVSFDFFRKEELETNNAYSYYKLLSDILLMKDEANSSKELFNEYLNKELGY